MFLQGEQCRKFTGEHELKAAQTCLKSTYALLEIHRLNSNENEDFITRTFSHTFQLSLSSFPIFPNFLPNHGRILQALTYNGSQPLNVNSGNSARIWQKIRKYRKTRIITMTFYYKFSNFTAKKLKVFLPRQNK